jgi:deoxyribodipyrimidine photo-lyase
MWFRRDLRLADNPALLQAVAAGNGQVAGLFVLDPRLLRPAGGPRRNHLLTSLARLDKAIGGRLIVRHGDPVQVVPAVASEVSATSVHVSSDYGRYGARRDAAVAKVVPLIGAGSPYAVTPGRLRNQRARPYLVFTPYYRAWLDHGAEAPFERPSGVEWIGLGGDPLPAYEVMVGAGETAARRTWTRYLDRLAAFHEERDRPDLDSTSRMSVPLKYGELHPRTLLGDLASRQDRAADEFRRQLAWREFCADLLARHPDAAWKPLRPEFERMAYNEPGTAFQAWCDGRTGFPIVDAGMRQLTGEGFIHNRVRMLVASFLVKDLHVHWKHGARWFMRWLRDGDLASNSLNWQWVAGCGADAAPYFRIFNPVTQGLKHDPHGDYVHRWVPELRGLPGPAAHEPWKHGGAAGYPGPITDHAEARLESLRRYSTIRSA